MSDIMLSCRGVSKVYKMGAKDLCAVDGVTLDIKRGGFTAIVGPSGAGKSTLMHILGGLDRPTSGSVTLGDEDIYALSDTRRARARNARIGFVFQFYHLLPEYTALENVMLPTSILNERRMTSDERRKLALNALKSVGLEERAGHLPSELSGGESQRVAIARALVNSPDILLCDEPTGNLDSNNSLAIYDILSDIRARKNTTLVIVSHDEKLASRATEVICIKDGRLA
jgi:lipoprotein-releasing system ATP-binding protein